MLTRKPYFIASLCFAVMLVAFQYFAMNAGFEAYQYGSPYDQTRADQVAADVAQTAPGKAALMVCLIGDDNDAAVRSASWMLGQLKLTYEAFEQLSAEVYAQEPQTLLIAADVPELGDISRLAAYLEEGGQAIFLRLPGEIGQSQPLMDLLGVLEIGAAVTCERFEAYEGLLLGGMVRYEKTDDPTVPYISLTAPRIRVNSLCKVWACMWAGEPNDRMLEVPLIFEKRQGQGITQVVNAAFMEDASGIGILTALLSIPREAFVYPVVNAMTIALRNYPLLSADEAPLRLVYARDAYQTCRDIIWPELSAMLADQDLRATAYLPAIPMEQYESELPFFMRVLSQRHSELGLTAPATVSPTLAAAYPHYRFCAAWGETAGEDTKAIVRMLNIADPGVALQQNPAVYPVLTEGYRFDPATDFRLRGFATGLYMVHHSVNLALPLLLQSPEHAWQQMAREMASTFHDSTLPFPQMRRECASAGSLDMLAYRAQQLAFTVDERGLLMKGGLPHTQTYCILRTKRTIASADGLSFEQLEKGVYLLALEGEEGSIVWEEKPSL